MTFIGRKSELEILQELKSKNKANLLVISGRRRIGKSKLAEEFGKNYEFYSFTGLPPSGFKKSFRYESSSWNGRKVEKNKNSKEFFYSTNLDIL